MKTYLITYELVVKDGPNIHKSVFTIQDVKISVDRREDIVPELRKMYPMYNIDLTTCNVVRPTFELFLNKNNKGWYYMGVVATIPSGERKIFLSLVTPEYALKCAKDNNLVIENE